MLNKEISRYVNTLSEQAVKQVLAQLIQSVDAGKPLMATDRLVWLKENAEEFNKFYPEGW